MQDDTPTAVQRAPAFEDELAGHELPSRPRHRLLGASANPLGVALLCALLTALGFIGGVLVEKSEAKPGAATVGASALTTRVAALRSGGSGGGLGRAAAAAAARGGTSTVGQVAYVSGRTLYVTGFEGNTIKVTAAPGASVTRTVKTSLKAIRPGETVIVTGSSGRNGAIRAQSIRASEAAAGGGFAGPLFGGGGGAHRNDQESGEGPVLFGK